MTAPFMLDTNVVSVFMHGRNAALDDRISSFEGQALLLSSIAYAETCYGLRNRPKASRLHGLASALFARVAILPWTRETGDRYGYLRVEMRNGGKSLRPLDMLIAAHALEAGATLVSNDSAFRHVPGLKVEDWTAD